MFRGSWLHFKLCVHVVCPRLSRTDFDEKGDSMVSIMDLQHVITRVKEQKKKGKKKKKKK